MQAVYYRAPDGSEPVNDLIDLLDVKRQVALDNQIDRLNLLRPHSPTPLPARSQVEGELRERRLAQFEEIARLVIKHRAARGLTQQELAERVGTSHSAVRH